jgi:hypothetical protein
MLTDNESAKMATSHGVLQGYNAKSIVDEKHQVVLHGEAFGRGEDSSIMGPMLEGAKDKLEATGWKEALKDMPISADTGYYSVTNLEACKNMKLMLTCRIPDFANGIFEPVFGNLRICKIIAHFTLRGRIKATIQWMLYCLVHNLEKISNFGKTDAESRV